MAGRLKRGDVHLCRFPSPEKQRRVLVLMRDSSVGHLLTGYFPSHVPVMRRADWAGESRA
jgi:hypothetical protein